MKKTGCLGWEAESERISQRGGIKMKKDREMKSERKTKREPANVRKKERGERGSRPAAGMAKPGRGINHGRDEKSVGKEEWQKSRRNGDAGERDQSGGEKKQILFFFLA